MKKKILIFVIFLLVVSSALFISYGYKVAQVYNNDTSKKTTFINQKLSVEYSDGKETLLSNNTSFIPGSVIIKEFNIKNTGNVSITYNVKLTDLINEFKRPSDINYSISLNGEIIGNSTFPIYNDSILAGNITIGVNETQKFILKIEYNNSNENQIIDSGSKLNAKLSFEEEQYKIKNVLIYGNSNETASLGSKGEIILSVNSNLLKNGYGQYDDNTNFSNLEYSNILFTNISKGVFKTTGIETKSNSELIPIDSKKEYIISLSTLNLNEENQNNAVGFVSYDNNKDTILSNNISYVINSLTYLTEDLKYGDTIIHLNSTEGFIKDDNNTGIIVWNYKDKWNNLYKEETYSRNVYTNIYTSNDIGYNTINLLTPWQGETIKKDTKISQSINKSEINYMIPISHDGEWSKYNNSILGTNIYSSTGEDSSNEFRFGTNYISLYLKNSIPNINYTDLFIGKSEFIIEKKIKINEQLECVGTTCDYIDVLNKKIINYIKDGKILNKPTYIDVDIPDLSYFYNKQINAYDNNISTSNIKIEYQ